MEKSRVAWVLMICLVLSVSVRQSSAAQSRIVAFGLCYGACFVVCSNRTGTTPGYCALKCFNSCLITESTVPDTQSFCELGCASAVCSNISSTQNPATNEVESCVGRCSVTCSQNN
ncbi:hypothetical protein like AT1G12663 [Hibiscus trionum]|uniref:Thionin-like protein 2 n=1 Tax=Hibiscus trionum TaxID=183268 RepID=A0A9W7J7W7_HIBTR|nr:hypothetical protein like AT1G12663 [Hibiscus trionum]